ncbi:MAG: flagellin [Planctomycetota bacterium]
MTRINTNVGSLVGQNNLQRANASLSQSLTRLSTGLRINTGADDPAGLIASENLRSDITSIQRAIGNTDRANQVIATADSALGQVSSLLNDIRGLVTESANAGALSEEQIAANQLQVDSSLEALNRIAQTTTFQGRRLLDGSLDFLTTPGSNFSNLSDLQIDQANLGATGSIAVDIDVSTAATRAQVDVGGIAAGVAGVASSGSLTFSDAAVASTGTVSLPFETTPAAAATGSVVFTVEDATGSTQADGSFDLTATGQLTVAGETINIVADAAGNAANANINTVVINGGQGQDNSSITGTTLTINIQAALGGGADVDDIILAINNGADGTGGNGDDLYTASSTGGATTISGAQAAAATTTAISGGAQIGLTAVDNSEADGAEGNGVKNLAINYDQGGSSADYDAGTNTLTVNVTQSSGNASLQHVIDAINAGEAGDGSDNDFDAVIDAGTGADLIRIPGSAVPATFQLTDIVGANSTTENRTISLTTAAGGNLDFNLEIQTVATSSITDADGSDGITAGISGDAASGYTVQIANDAVVDLDNLATFLQNQISEVATATINGTASFDFDAREGQAVAPAAPVAVTGSQAQVTNSDTISITGTTAAGALGNLAISFVEGNVVDGGGGSLDLVAVSGDATNGYVVTVDDTETVTYGDIATVLQSQITEIQTATATTPGRTFDTGAFNAGAGNTTLTGGRDAGDDVITVTSDATGAAFDGNLTFNTSNSTTGGIGVTVTGTDITVSVDATSSYNLSDIVSAISAQSGYTATLTGTAGSGTFDANDANDNSSPVSTNLTGGVDASGGLVRDAVIELAGALGSEVFNLQQGTDIATLEAQINLVSDATGVIATANGTSLELRSTEYGSDASVEITVRDEASDGTFTTAFGGDPGSRAVGSDVQATVNGVQATGDGNELSINTSTLDLTTTVAADTTGTSSFTINGGGALFQLGPDVVSNQQARLGISSVNTAALGGVSGSLYQLASGGTADLTADPTTAASIVEEAINQVTSLRGRLGAFQRTTLETNKNALNDTLTNLTEAESSIRDADFAAETAELTRSQILVQSGTRVLAIANQNPQNVLALLG